MRTTRFWRAFDELIGPATCRCDWVRHLRDEWPAGASLLRKTGKVADAIGCRNPGDLGCERQIVQLIDGRLRAECGDIPRRCDHVELTRDEIVVLEVDRRKLVRAIGRALGLSDAPDVVGRSPVLSLGRYDISAGRGFPVFLATPRPDFGLPVSALGEVAGIAGPKLLLTPTRRSIDQDLRRYLAGTRTTLLALDDLLLWNATRGFVPAGPVEELFAAPVAEIAAESAAMRSSPSIDLPPGTRWKDVSMTFTGPQTISLTAAGQNRVVGPPELGMGRKNSDKPTVQWRLLQEFAEQRGRLPVGTPSAQKQKQSLSAKLCAATGIAEDPIVAEGGYYQTLFAIEGEPLSKGRRDQNRRRA